MPSLPAPAPLRVPAPQQGRLVAHRGLVTAAALLLATAFVTGCTVNDHATGLPPGPAVSGPAVGRTPQPTRTAARNRPAAAEVEAARVAAGAAARARLGLDRQPTDTPPDTAPGASAMTSGSGALVGKDGTGWLDQTVTSGQWDVRVTCTGTGSIVAYAGSPAVLARLARPATAAPDPQRVHVRCGTTVAFAAGRPGRDGLEVLVVAEQAVPLTGVAFALRRAG